jgi:hypothetical protein
MTMGRLEIRCDPRPAERRRDPRPAEAGEIRVIRVPRKAGEIRVIRVPWKDGEIVLRVP